MDHDPEAVALIQIVRTMMNLRIKKLQQWIAKQGLDGILVMKPENRRYFSGFTGSSGILLISVSDAKLITDFRYVEQAKTEAPDCEVICHKANIFDDVTQVISSQDIKTLGFESDFITYDLFQTITSKLMPVNLIGQKLDHFRMVKDDSELAALKQAVTIADQAFSQILLYLSAGRTEKQIAMELEYIMRSLGSEKPAFDTIVVSGARSSLPHGQPTDKVIADGDLVTIDFGAVYKGYHSDITRTVVIGQASAKQRELYDLVLQAQLAGVRAVLPARTGVEVDQAARQIIAAAGYGSYFGHGLGHGVGLAIHEAPRLSPTAPASEIHLEPGMTVTVEPGIYLPDWGGIRIEDTVVVTAEGCDILTATSKQLIEIE